MNGALAAYLGSAIRRPNPSAWLSASLALRSVNLALVSRSRLFHRPFVETIGP
jgi:hypothetical protein